MKQNNSGGGDGLFFLLFIVSYIASAIIIVPPTNFFNFVILILFAFWLTMPLLFMNEQNTQTKIAAWLIWVVTQPFIYYSGIEAPESFRGSFI